MSKTITFNVKLMVDGKEQVVVATTSTKDLGKAFARRIRQYLKCHSLEHL